MQRLIFLTAIQWTCSCDLGVASSDIGLISLTMGSCVFRAVANGGGGQGGQLSLLDLLSRTASSLWMKLFSLDSVIVITVTCNCLPFSCPRSIFRRHVSWQVLKIAFRDLQTWTFSGGGGGGYPQTRLQRLVPSALAIMSPPPHPRYKKPSYGPRFVGLTHKNGSFFSYTKIGSRLIQFECTCKCTTRLSADWTFWVRMGVC